MAIPSKSLMERLDQRVAAQLDKLLARKQCNHQWEITFAHSRTLVPTERRCLHCGARQRAETVWRDIAA